MYMGRILPALVALAVAAVAWATFDRIRAAGRRPTGPDGLSGADHPGSNQFDTTQIDRSVRREYGGIDVGRREWD
jgi:hypothetical protein